jgi:hypothetical protein
MSNKNAQSLRAAECRPLISSAGFDLHEVVATNSLLRLLIAIPRFGKPDGRYIKLLGRNFRFVVICTGFGAAAIYWVSFTVAIGSLAGSATAAVAKWRLPESQLTV